MTRNETKCMPTTDLSSFSFVHGSDALKQLQLTLDFIVVIALHISISI